MYHEMINSATKQYPFLIEHINVKYIPHFHEQTEIVFVKEGSLSVTVGEESFTLESGEICIITPDLIHNLYSHEYNKTFVMKLFSVVDIKGIRLEKCVIGKDDEIYPILNEYITQMIDENEKRELGYELSVNINAEKIFLAIIRNMKYDMLENKLKIKQDNQNEFLSSIIFLL